jgi:hypothetical protein
MLPTCPSFSRTNWGFGNTSSETESWAFSRTGSPGGRTRGEADDKVYPTCVGIMTPDHERWPEFQDRLAEALAGPTAWATRDPATIVRAAEKACDGTYSTARAILATMGMDVEASLEFFTAHGCCCGGCDCEVLSKLEVDFAAGACGCAAAEEE